MNTDSQSFTFLTRLCSKVKALAFALVIVAACANATTTHAQCPPAWQPFDASTASFPGVDGIVFASVMWDPDGPAGPIPPRLVIGGRFTIASNLLDINNIAVYDPASGQWSRLGTGMAAGSGIPTVSALTTLPNGDLIAGGFFTTAGGVAARNIARWNGSAWSPLGTGTNNGIRALTVLPSGDLIAGGSFTTAGGVAANRIARWNGSAWSALGTGMNVATSLDVLALATLPSGDLIAGGNFTIAGGLTVNGIARWNGSAWSALGTGMSHPVTALTVLPSGDLIAGGTFTTAGGVPANFIARWNGSAWSPLGTGMIPTGVPCVNALATLPSGDLIAIGQFSSAGGVSANGIARWNGSSWSALGTGLGGFARFFFSLTVLPSGDLFAGGNFTTAGGVGASGIARWNGSAWSALSAGINNTVNALTKLPNGDLIAAGSFTTIAGGVPANGIARWDGVAWSALGSGIGGGSGDPAVSALTTLPNGDLIAGGNFTTAGGVAANRIARWNGSAWFPLGSGMNSSVTALTSLPNGDVIAGGVFTNAGGVPVNNIARWNGSAWSPLGSGITSANTAVVFALTTLPSGDVIAGGVFSEAGGVAARNIARWNGSAWSPLGAGVSNTLNALATLPNGNVIAGGIFTSPGSRIARWNGSAWSELGFGADNGVNGEVYALTTLPNGDIIAGGLFWATGGFSGVLVDNIARWNGSEWSALSALGTGVNNRVNALTTLPNGDLIAGGTFSAVGGTYARFIARYNFGTPAPTIATQPLPQSACPAGSATFTIAAGGSGPFTYQWRAGGTPINTTTNPSAATSTLTLTNVQPGNAGSYDCIVTNACGSVTSNVATLTLLDSCCDSIDFNNNDVFPEDQDVIDFFEVLAGGDCSPGNTCSDIDFNNNGVFPEDQDVIDFFNVLAGGTCP